MYMRRDVYRGHDIFSPNNIVEGSGCGQSAIAQQTQCNMQFVLSFTAWNHENNNFKSQTKLYYDMRKPTTTTEYSALK